MNNTLWGIDLGGTKIEGVVLDPDAGHKILARQRVPTEQEHGYEHIQAQIAKLLDQLAIEVGHRPQAIGVGTPGTIDMASRSIKNSNTTCLNGQPIRDDLSARLGIPVRIANDANCFALAEARMGAAAQLEQKAVVVLGLIIGTGVGGGIVVNDQVINGLQGIGGEWGHNFLDESGGMCFCGRVGCVERIISGPMLEKYYANLSGQKRKLPEIVERHEARGDPHASQTVERLLQYFGKALAPVINILDPDVIVVGGGVGNVDLLYTSGRDEVAKYIMNDQLQTPILKPELGDSAGVLGAAWLVA